MTENLFTNNATDQEQLMEIATLEAETARLLRWKYKEQICALKDGVAELKTNLAWQLGATRRAQRILKEFSST